MGGRAVPASAAAAFRCRATPSPGAPEAPSAASSPWTRRQHGGISAAVHTQPAPQGPSIRVFVFPPGRFVAPATPSVLEVPNLGPWPARQAQTFVVRMIPARGLELVALAGLSGDGVGLSHSTIR